MRNLSIQKNGFYKWLVLLTVTLGNVMVMLDISILAACLPQLARVFNSDPSVIGWINIIYFIMSQSLMLTFSKIADAVGRKKIFMMAIVIYMIGLLAAALSRSVLQLIVARSVQGASGATIVALSIAITVAAFPSEERGKALGIITGAASTGLIAGPALGGIILDLLGWRAIFYTRIPFMAISLLMAWVVLQEQKRTDDKPFSFDFIGAITLFGWLSCFLLVLSFSKRWDLVSFPNIILVTIAIILFMIFIIAENKAQEPIVDLTLFKKRIFATAVISSIVITIGSSSIAFLFPFFLMEGFGMSGTEVGFYMGLLAMPTLILAPLSGRLSDKIGSRFLSTFGVILVCGGMLQFIRLNMEASFLDIGAAVLLVGSGVGIFHPPNNSVLVGSVSREMLGVASAIGTAARNIGTSLTFALSGALYSAYKVYHYTRLQSNGIDQIIAEKTAAISGFSNTLVIILVITSAAILTSFFRGPDRPVKIDG